MKAITSFKHPSLQIVPRTKHITPPRTSMWLLHNDVCIQISTRVSSGGRVLKGIRRSRCCGIGSLPADNSYSIPAFAAAPGTRVLFRVRAVDPAERSGSPPGPAHCARSCRRCTCRCSSSGHHLWTSGCTQLHIYIQTGTSF